jgi:hypothetical protein
MTLRHIPHQLLALVFAAGLLWPSTSFAKDVSNIEEDSKPIFDKVITNISLPGTENEFLTEKLVNDTIVESLIETGNLLPSEYKILKASSGQEFEIEGSNIFYGVSFFKPPKSNQYILSVSRFSSIKKNNKQFIKFMSGRKRIIEPGYDDKEIILFIKSDVKYINPLPLHQRARPFNVR